MKLDFGFAESDGERMRYALRIAGIFLIVIGAIWILQGINVLPGSFMTGQMRWAYRGGIAVVVGTGLLFAARRVKL
jgi:uncharacterized protein YjeT (DUF2065 family)